MGSNNPQGINARWDTSMAIMVWPQGNGAKEKVLRGQWAAAKVLSRIYDGSSK